MTTMGQVIMGEHIRLREATERANASLEAIKEMVPYINNHGAMLNAFGQMLYELNARLSALEAVLTRYLDSNSPLTFTEILAQHIDEQQAKVNAQSEVVDDSPTPTTEETGPSEEAPNS